MVIIVYRFFFFFVTSSTHQLSSTPFGQRMVAEGTRNRARFRGLICPTCFHPSLRRVTVARNYANEIVFANGTRSSKGNYSRGGGVERASLSLDEVSLPIREGEREGVRDR